MFPFLLWYLFLHLEDASYPMNCDSVLFRPAYDCWQMEHVQCFDLPVLILTASTCGLWHIIGDHGEHVGSRVCFV